MVKYGCALLVILTVGFACALPVSAQPDGFRVEVAGGLGLIGIRPVVRACCELRTPPAFTEVGSHEGAVEPAFGVRVRESGRTSTAVQAGWARTGEVVLSYPPVEPQPPLSAYTSERRLRARTFTVSASQALDFPLRDRTRGYLAAGLVLSRQSWNQRDTSIRVDDPAVHRVEEAGWSFTRPGGALAGGLKLYTGKRFFAAAETGAVFLAAKEGEDENRARWAVGRETRFFLRLQIGAGFLR